MQGHTSRRSGVSAHRDAVAEACCVDAAVLTPLVRVSQRVGLEPLAARLVDLQQWLADDLASLEASIANFARCCGEAPSSRTRMQQAGAHLLGTPGKRVRPLCVVLAARLGGRALDTTVRRLALACEAVHAATLLHDDVIDNSTERRGVAAARVLFGNSASILAGDHLLVEALRLVQIIEPAECLTTLLDVIAQMVAAEALQLERRGRFEPSREVYLEVIRGKTAALFSWGLQVGGLVGGLDAPAMAALARLGLKLGMAFQLVDDVLDIEGNAQLLGKETLVDLREGKLTWPLILAAERDALLAEMFGQLAASATLSRELQDGEGALLSAVRQRLSASGALQAARADALAMAEEACAQLRWLPIGPARDALAWVIESAVSRAR